MNTTMPTLEELHALARDEGVWARGLRLAQQGAVSETTRRGPQIAARVAGSADEPYYVAATPPPEGQRRWQWHCTCFYFEHVAAPCKHIIALLVAWRRDAAQFSAEAARDALMGSADRDNAQAARRAELRRHPTLSALLALEPERAKPLKRALNLDPYAKQLDFAARRGEAHLWEGILQTAAGYLRIGDVANAQRLSSLLLERLLAQGDGPARLIAIRQRTLLLLEAIALERALPADEQAAWLATVQGWWRDNEEPQFRDGLLNLLIHPYQPTDQPLLEPWLRGLLAQPAQHNRQSSALWRTRIVEFLLALYESEARFDDFEQLCWEEGQDDRAALRFATAGDIKRAARIAQSGLGSSDGHRQVAEALHQQGATDAARRVAERGLGYDDEGRADLLAWLSRVSPMPSDALARAEAAWQAAPTLDHYRTLRHAAERAGTLPDLHARTRAQLDADDYPLPVQLFILAEEGMIEQAKRRLSQAGWQREPLTEQLATQIATAHPTEAITLWIALAEARAAPRNRAAYRRAADALAAARQIAEQSGELATWDNAFAAFRAAHRRQSALWEEVAAAGVELAS